MIAARGADVTTETWMAGGWQSWQSADAKYLTVWLAQT
jgi:hypothetical protein